MEPYQTPELLRTPLEELCLSIKLLELGSVTLFLSKAIQSPPMVSIKNALDLLNRLGALDEKEHLTTLGTFLATLPMDPRLGKMILYGAIFQCLDPILTIAACLSYRDPFILPLEFEKAKANSLKYTLANSSYSDMITLLNAYNGFQHALSKSTGAAHDYCRYYYIAYNTMQMITELRQQYLEILIEAGFVPNVTKSTELYRPYNTNSLDMDVIRSVVVAGMYPYVARKHNEKKNKKMNKVNSICSTMYIMNVCRF
jgi:ATP-dependent RNA helicase DHX36